MEIIGKERERNRKYLVVCYSVHDRCISSLDAFDTYGEAHTFLRKDAKNTLVAEQSKGFDDAMLELFDDTAAVTSSNETNIWTWEIRALDIA